MNQHTYSFPKVTPVDADQLREDLKTARRRAAVAESDDDRSRDEVQARRLFGRRGD